MKKNNQVSKDKKKAIPNKQQSKSNQKTKPKTKKNPNSKFSKPKTQVVDYFPRGSGPKNDFTSNIGVINPSKKSSFLSKKRKQVSSQKKEKNEKIKKIEKSDTPEQPAGVMAPNFRIGDLVLLSICEIHKDYMILNYTRNKKAMVHSSYSGLTEKDEDFSFEKYFNIGQFVVGAVVSPGNDIRLHDGRLNKKIQVSIDPKIINTGLVAERIMVGMDLYGQLIYDKNKNKYTANFKIASSKKTKFNKNDDDEDDNSSDDDNDNSNDNINNNIEINLIDNDEEEDKKALSNKKINSYYFFKVVKAFYNKKKYYQIDISMNFDKYHFPIKAIDFSLLRPGFLFKADVIRNLVNGVEVSFGTNLVTIFADHLQSEKKEKNIIVRVIHLSLNKKLASLSSLSNIKKLNVENVSEKEKLIGTICSTKVSKLLYGGSCQVELSITDENNKKKIISSNAFLHCKNFPHVKIDKKDEKKDKKDKKSKMELEEEKEGDKDEDENKDEEEDEDEDDESNNYKNDKDDEAREIISGIKKEVKEGDEFDKVVIKEYNFFDDKPIITTNISNSEQGFISYETIKVGDFVSCQIKHIDPKTLHVTINKYIQGKIPLVHITDYPLNKMPLKFKLGQTIKARVFLYNKETKNLILTMKESLLLPEVKLYSDLSEMKEGESVYVVYLGSGLYSHSNNIIGTLKNSKSVKEKELKIGKLYNFNIFKINVKSKKILFTKGNEVWVPNCGDYESFIKRNQIMSNIITVLNTLVSSEVEKINEGDICDFTFVDLSTLIKSLIKKGVNSKLLEENQNALLNEFIVVKYISKNTNNGNYYGFIIKEQISDYFNEIIFKKMQKYTQEENEENKVYKLLVLYHNKESKNLFVSMKQSLMDNKDDILHLNENIKDISEQNFEQNKIYFGFVNKKNDKGVTLQFYGKKKLLIRPKEATYDYHPGQTIKCKYHKNKFYINSELLCTYSKDEIINESNNKLFYYLNDKKNESEINFNTSLKNGDSIEITIESIEDEYILGKDKNNNEIYICCNLYDFSYKNSKYDLPQLSVGEKINIKIKKMKKNDSEIVIGEMPDVLINKLVENGNKIKSEFESESSLNIGDEVLCRITSVKEKYIYTLINNKFIGKMDIENYQGNIEKIKKLLKETIGIRKMSVESKDSNGSKVTNNYPKELLINAEIIDIIKLQNKLSHSEIGVNKKKKIKKLKIYQIVPKIDMNNEMEIEEENDLSNSGLTNDQISSILDTSGKEINVGIINAIKPLNKYPIMLKIKNYSESKLQVPFNEIPINMVKDDGELRYKLGHKIKFYYNKSNNVCSILPPSYKEANKDIQIGKKYLARILKKLDGKGLIISIRKDVETFVDICEITDFLHYNPLDFYKIGQFVKCRILSHDDKTSKYFASLRQSIVIDEEYDIIQNGSTIKFAEKFSSTLSVDLRNKIIKFGLNNVLKQNTICIGYIISSSEKGLFIKVASNVTVRAALHELTDEISIIKPYLLFKKNNICICRVISVYDKDPNNIKINVSLKESIIKYPITLHMKDLVLNNFYNCQIISENKDKKYFIVNIIGSTFTGKLLNKNINEKIIKNNNLKIGEIIVLQLTEMDKENKKYSFSNLFIDENFDKKIIINQLNDEILQKSEENMEIYKNIQNIISEAIKEKEMQELIDMNINGENGEGPEEIDFDGLVNRQGINPLNEESEEEDNENNEEEDESEEGEEKEDSLDQDENVIKDKEKAMKIMTTEKKDEDEDKEEDEENEEEEDENGIEVEDENGEDENDDNKKKKSKNKEKDNLKKEIAIREIEKENENDEIKNGQYYERLILKDHDNSINWIAYASYILDTLNLASSRKIFERALKVVDIAKTNEKFNLWIAYLNLENVYGDKKSFQKILDRAKEVCDKKLLYSHLIKIYMDSKKYEDASDLYKLLIKDYFNDLEIWKKYIEFLFQIQKLKSGDKKVDDNAQMSDMSNLEIIEPKEGLDKSMQVLPKKTHLDIMSWYGQLLYINGNNEEARNMFDNILKNFPKRKDIWFVYIDKEVKYGNIDKVRQIFDKMFEVKFKINDLKSVMKKFLEFEKKHCKDEKEFVKAQEKTKSILEKRMGVTESKNKKENEEEENDEEDDE